MKPESFRTPRRRLLSDRIARGLVSGGGMATIAGILGILFFIFIEILPLFGSADVALTARFPLDGEEPGAVVVDEHRTHAATFAADGQIVVRSLATGDVTHRLDSGIDPTLGPWKRIQQIPGEPRVAIETAGGDLFALTMDWTIEFDEATRVITPDLSRAVPFDFFDEETARIPLQQFSLAFDDDGAIAGAAITEDGRLLFARQSIEEDFMSGEETTVWERTWREAPGDVSSLLLDRQHTNIFAGTESGAVIWWVIDDGEPQEPRTAENEAPITAMTFLIGDQSLITGDVTGRLGVWFPVPSEGGGDRLGRIRGSTQQKAPIVGLSPSPRDKGVLSVDASGGMALYYSTSNRLLWSGNSPVGASSVLYYAPKANGAIVAGADELALLDIDNPHPEIGWNALFGRVWYEGYDQPERVWQSTGGTDVFEPKLSLTPLIVGTFKGTFYSLILAIPLAVLGAMYTSQFMHPRLRRTVKPTVELMAALPSVVLGFLAGLWLAPRLEMVLPALVAMLVIVPAFVLLAGVGWRSLPNGYRHRFPDGFEALLQLFVIAIAMFVAFRLNGVFEAQVFAGDVRQWLFDTTGLRYDQRNAIVVGLAMGFAVIPIIFSIAEDAFSNVPQNLVSGSLALGANRWQTVTRVVLPTASPGIFSAIMIGFGRAIGETMIVLMATGNTPLMDWSPFNGFRTLSANIAVEIPEAPHSGTLYRVLFLAAALLFVFTFVANTGAELIRQRLRKRYAQL
ncbi:MAG: ABC transporter permease subunit [Acidobacteriota bacterium]|nr:ABC transporter permease subunit [Acidobacteriota bacterium]